MKDKRGIADWIRSGRRDVRGECPRCSPCDELPPSHLRLQRFAGKPIAIRNGTEPLLLASAGAAPHPTSAGLSGRGAADRVNCALLPERSAGLVRD